MAKDLSKTVSTYAKNLGKRLKRIATRQEAAGDALKGIAGDSRKLRRAIASNRGPHNHQRAAKYLEKGRKAYNQKDYRRAEDLFRKAVLEDSGYALAYTFLGNAKYKQDELREAVNYWSQAVEMAPGSDAAVKAGAQLRKVSFQRDKLVSDLESLVSEAQGKRID